MDKFYFTSWIKILRRKVLLGFKIISQVLITLGIFMNGVGKLFFTGLDGLGLVMAGS